MDLLGVGSLALVALEWLALGWLSGIDWPAEMPSFWAPRWAMRLLVGGFLVGLAQLLLAGLGLGVANIPAVLIAAAAAASALRLVNGTKRAPLKPLTVDRREGAGWLLLGGVLAAATVRSVLVPEAGWDAFSHWGLRAQAFTVAGTIVNAHSEHEYYPPLVPLLESWLYLHRGLINIDLGKTVWALIGSAFAVALAWHLRLSLRAPWLAPVFGVGILLGTTALMESFWTGQADLALTAYLSLATLAIMQWHRAASRTWLIQAAIFGAAATLTKFEGLPRVGVLVVALCVVGGLDRDLKYARPLLILTAAAGVATLLWTVFELGHGIAPNAEHLGQFQPLALGSMLLALVGVFGGVRTGGGVLVAVLAWTVAGRELWCPELRLLTLVVLGQLLATLAAFMLSSTSPELEVRTSATRLFEQFLPLALYTGAVGLSRETSTYNRRGR